jgi:peptidoglycan hydrolase-like protein with peptidoglycan-binding domain
MRPSGKSIFKATILISALLACGTILPMQAQQSHIVPTAREPAQDKAKDAFETLPEADRKAMQDGLIWAGDYKGIADGHFGKGTRDAIVAFAARLRLAGDGTLDEKGRAALAAAAQRAKATVRFSIISDERTAIGIGVPMKLLPKVSAVKGGTRYASSDNSAFLETSLVPESEGSLEQRFDALRNDTAQRKVTYKVARPDFFVVVGEATGAIFYTRFVRTERNGVKMLAGYTLSYPGSAKSTYDVMAIAIANTFEPLAAKPAPGKPEPFAAKRSTVQSGASPAAPAEHAMADAPTKPFLAANGLVIAPGLVLTSLPANKCRDAQIGARNVKIARLETTSGMALLEAGNFTGSAVVVRSGRLQADTQVAVLAYAPKATSAADERLEDLVVAPGLLRSSSAGMRVLAASQGVHPGSMVFDRSGAFIGLMPAMASPEKSIGHILPSAPRPMIDAATVTNFLGNKRLTENEKPVDSSGEHSLGEIVAANRAAIVPVYCVP